MKFVAVRHSKSVAKLSNPIKQVKIITQELEALEKTTIFDIALVTIERPENNQNYYSTDKQNKGLYIVKSS